MDQQQAMGFASRLAASYPASYFSDASLLAYLGEFIPLDEHVAERMLERLVATSERPPSVAQVREAYRIALGSYDYGNQGARPLPDKEMTPEERERSMAFFVKLREEMYARHPEWSREGIHRNSMFNETAEERIERTRALARQPIPPEQRVSLSSLERGSRSFGACGGSGKLPVEEPDGTLRCPDCGAIVEPIVVSVPARSQASGLVR